MTESNMVYQLKITLRRTKPAIWRRILVPSGITFADLHVIIQIAMGWDNLHLYEFSVAGVRIGENDVFDDMIFDEILSADDTIIDDHLKEGLSFSYTYDFGDDWGHTVKVEKVTEAKPDVSYPVCLKGARACPPDDCGGIWGYEQILMKNSSDQTEKGSPVLRLLPSVYSIDAADNFSFDPEAFDIEQINSDLLYFMKALGESRNNSRLSVETWRRLYDLAIQIRDIKPWTAFRDIDYIAVWPKSYSSPIFFVTLGILTEMTAMAVFPNEEALRSMDRIRERARTGVPLAALGIQDSIMCYFGNRSEIQDEDRQVIKELNLKFRGSGQWIYFRSVKPGFAPWHINSSEADILIDTMEQFIAAFNQRMSGEYVVDFDAGEVMLRCETDDGWVNETMILSPAATGENKLIITDELYLARLRKCRKANFDVELDIVYMPTPVSEHKDSRPFFPQVILIVKRSGDAVLEQGIIEPNVNVESALFQKLEDFAKVYGRPRSICVRDHETALLVEDWCRKLGVGLKEGGDMVTMNETVYSLLDVLGIDDDDDY